MEYSEVFDLISAEEKILISQEQDIIAGYIQLSRSLTILKEQIYPLSFDESGNWRNKINSENTSFYYPEGYTPESAGYDGEYNAKLMTALMNNVYACINLLKNRNNELTLEEILKIQKTDSTILWFVNRLYEIEYPAMSDKMRIEYAQAMQKTINSLLEKTITPYWERRKILLYDRWRTVLKPEIAQIVQTQEEYQNNPLTYDSKIKELCRKHEVPVRQKVLEMVVADIGVTEKEFIDKLVKRYQDTEQHKDSAKLYKLRDVVSRYAGQTNNLEFLNHFFGEVSQYVFPLSFREKIIDFFMRLFTGTGITEERKVVSFSYASRRGEIHRETTNIRDLLNKIQLFRDYLFRVESKIENPNYTKKVPPGELEKIVDVCTGELESIYEKSNGFREWLGLERNEALLESIPGKQQADFNKTLLRMNHTLIINKQTLRELGGRFLMREQPDEQDVINNKAAVAD